MTVPSQPPPRIALYARSATEEQGASTTDRQLTFLRIWAVSEALPPTVAMYQDVAVSGASAWQTRPGLSALIRAADAAQLDLVLVSSLDRFARSHADLLDLIQHLTGAGVRVRSPEWDSAIPTCTLILEVLAEAARTERDVLAERGATDHGGS